MRNCERENNRARKNFVRARKILKLRAQRARAARGLMSSLDISLSFESLTAISN